MDLWLNRNGPHTANDAAARRRLYDASLEGLPSLPQGSCLPGGIGFDQNASSSTDSETDIHPPRPHERQRRPQHSRSLSHPFPSLFAGKKKRQQESSDQDSSESERDADAKPMAKARENTIGRSQRGGHGRQGSHDFVNGNCMGCGSLLRWPGDLHVFRCTVCLTINDVGPRLGGVEERDLPLARGGGHEAVASFQSPPTASSKSPRYISTSITRRIVRKCLATFIEKSLNEAEHDGLDLGLQDATTSTAIDSKMRHKLAPLRTTAGPQGWVSTKAPQDHGAKYLFDEPPTLRPNPIRGSSSSSRSYSASYPERPAVHAMLQKDGPSPTAQVEPNDSGQEAKRIFKPLEDYIISCFNSFSCVNSSFVSGRQRALARAVSVSRENRQTPQPRRDTVPSESPLCDLDPKLLLLGDFAENGSWWTGSQAEARPFRSNTRARNDSTSYVNLRSPLIDWGEVSEWYIAVINAAESWRHVFGEVVSEKSARSVSQDQLRLLESKTLAGQHHTQRVLLKMMEMLLKRPGRPITDPWDVRFLLIALQNPLLYPSSRQFHGYLQPGPRAEIKKREALETSAFPASGPLSGHHSNIIKRILGLMSNSSPECHNHLVAWFARLDPAHFKEIKDLVSSFLSYRLLRSSEGARKPKVDVTAGLIPRLATGGSRAALHSVLGASLQGSTKSQVDTPRTLVHGNDWQIRAASIVAGLLFAANNLPAARREPPGNSHGTSPATHSPTETRASSYAQGQMVPTSDFYNSLIDRVDLVADFEVWEARRGIFAFCQYPFLLSISAKIKILEHEAKRQMLSKARDAFIDSIMTRKNVNQFLVLDVRRDCLVEDSLKAVSEIVGSGSEDIQKRLRIVFAGEEGVDHGGLRKEWFLLLVREVFNADHGMFVYDEDSQYCYFNPNSFETSDQFFLVGVVMGLAIYNSTILDVPLPPFAFRKLLASGPAPSPASAAHPRPVMTYSLDDLFEFRPALARGLNQLLEYDGDVEETFSLNFVVDTDRYGTTVSVPLCPDGQRKVVTNANRREYADLYTRYLLDISVSRQFEPFKRGFYTVCGGSALSLFQPEEIELLVRGSDEPLDITSLRAVAEYENWGHDSPDGLEPVLDWFWTTFERATPSNQRKLLLFITGSDRIPATGATFLHIKVSCLGDDCGRYPIARTCFNVLALWRYRTRQRLETMLWTAVHESEGFGLK